MKRETEDVATPCDVSGAQGLRRLKSCGNSGWCDVGPPYIATFATFVTFVGTTPLPAGENFETSMKMEEKIRKIWY